MSGAKMTIFLEITCSNFQKLGRFYFILDSKILRTYDNWVGCIKVHPSCSLLALPTKARILCLDSL